MKQEKFTKGYVDLVVSMMKDIETAKKFLLKDLRYVKHEITAEHYKEMVEYIKSK